MIDQFVKDKNSVFFTEIEKINQALAKAVQDALLKHKQAGNPVAIWRDGKVVWIPPEEILAKENKL
ncbi:hypothetical protein MC7420_437 [Coleofasciculus chthonoplastes PCC 7420]|uniref:Uncharacterized protein n=1 Tax=Coleofasciculus chthonoplastes PCC 7420 TaxID=118168 RepID=B4VL50_9CYAN|nr:hypothetical protein [Coleofasciculus chthonoplastes]EDX77300.1 hypothetical protein MC7420_437 [Coleofasciculus chthonoplastes PCC 7420]